MANSTNELYHFGVKGMRWGVRRYRNEDGSLTEAGKKHARQSSQPHKGLSPQTKRAIKIGAAVGVTALAVYGATKLVKSETGQKLVSQLLSRNGKTTLDIGKARMNDARTIRPTATNRKFVSGYKPHRMPVPTTEGRARVRRQLDREARYESKHAKSTARTDKMRDTIRRGENIHIDSFMDRMEREKQRRAERAEAYARAQQTRGRASTVRADSVFNGDDYTNELFRRNNKLLGL